MTTPGARMLRGLAAEAATLQDEIDDATERLGGVIAQIVALASSSLIVEPERPRLCRAFPLLEGSTRTIQQ